MKSHKSSSAIGVRHLLVQLAEDDLLDPSLHTRIDEFAADRKLNSVLMTQDGKLLLCTGNQQLHLNSGMSTLQKAIKLRHSPTRLTGCQKRLPDGFVKHCFPRGYDETVIRHTVGDKFQPSYIDSIAGRHDAPLPMEVGEAERDNDNGRVVDDVTEPSTSTGNAAGSEYDQRPAAQRNPDVEGALIKIVFDQWDNDPVTGVPVKTGKFPPVEVTIVGRPRRTDIKYKHYMIYSKAPGFGKTFHLTRLTEQYNFSFVTDANNWVDVPPESQFLIFDEVEHDQVAKPSFAQLKALTGGSATFGGNRKMYGASFKPRKDVQVSDYENTNS